MVASIHANLRYFVPVGLKGEIKMVSQNGFQNGLASDYFPEGSVGS